MLLDEHTLFRLVKFLSNLGFYEMKNYWSSSLFLILPLIFSKNALAQDQCNIENIINLSVFRKNDYKLFNYMCSSDQGLYLKNYIIDKKTKVFLNEYVDFAAKESPKLLAVSIYKSKNKKPPLVITINSSYYCCTPQIEGHMYKVNLYQVHKVNNNILLKDLTSILGENTDGFEGIAEGRVHYNLKDIASIKKWLDEYY